MEDKQEAPSRRPTDLRRAWPIWCPIWRSGWSLVLLLLLARACQLTSLRAGSAVAHLGKNLGKRQFSVDNASMEFIMDTNGDPVAASNGLIAPMQAPQAAPSSISLLSAAGTSDTIVDASQATLMGELSKQAANNGPSSASQQMATAYALAQEANRAASQLNTELCKSFSTGTQTETGGSFTSPSYPNPYPIDLICTRLIEAPAGHYIVLEFRDIFEIEAAGKDCDNDKIEIRDGRYGYSKVLARYCGTNFPPEVRSTNEAMWLRFISDASITHRGFKAVYRFEKQKDIKPNPPFASLPINTSNGTEGKSWIHSGVIKNQDVPEKLINYTKQFNVSLECIWNITVMPGWKIYLTFSNYELNKPNDCDSNFIEIYEENLIEDKSTVKFCGTRTESQTSKSNVFNIRHHALPTASGSKFEIIYTAFREKGNGACDVKTEFDCDDGTCIHESLRCDGLVNCKYRYDEATDPGPCPGSDPDSPFFETEHMVIILVVFLTLVSGMCASIVVSCWGKIQERKRRKLDYHMRKSREASMEGQLNEVEQMVYGSSKESSGSVNKQRIASATLSENHVNTVPKSIQEAILAANGNQRLLKSALGLEIMQQQNFAPGVQYQNNPILGQMMVDKGLGNYEVYTSGQLEAQNSAMASNSSLDVKANGFREEKQYNTYSSRGKVYDSSSDLLKSQQNLQQSLITSIAAAQMKSQNFDSNEQQSVPDISYNNQMKLQSGANVNNQMISPISNLNMAHDAQQQLNFSLNRNQQQPQQQRQSLINSIYHQRQLQHDNECNNISSNNFNINNGSNSNNSNNTSGNLLDNTGYIHSTGANETSLAGGNILLNRGIGRYLCQQQQQNFATINNNLSGMADHNMAISLAKYNSLVQPRLPVNTTGNTSQVDAINQLNYGVRTGSQLGLNGAYNPNRALTLSAVHQPMLSNQQRGQQQPIYGVNVNQAGQPIGSSNLSSSMSCCNILGDFANETPLLNDLLFRANQQRLHEDQEMRSLTMVPRLTNAPNFPRSLSAYQLSRAQVRQSHGQSQQQLHMQRLQQQSQEQEQQQQQQQQQQKHHQQQQIHLKSMSDAGKANRHKPPDHSLSYPHACTGPHMDDSAGPSGQSPAIPPPPPPPNLANMRSSTSSGTIPTGNPQMEGRRAAFKVSRLDPNQLTGDTLQESDVNLAGNASYRSMQMDDPSTESDATFGLLMNSIGNTSMNFNTIGRPMHPQATNQQSYQRRLQQAHYGLRPLITTRGLNQNQILSHMNECNFVRQRSSMANRPDMLLNQPLVCDCGALDRANQMRLQHMQATGSSHEFEDSDDGAYVVQHEHLRQPTLSKMADETSLIHSSCTQAGLNEQLKQHYSINDSMYDRQEQQSQRFSRFRHQSSELTADEEDEEDVNDDDMVGYDLECENEVRMNKAHNISTPDRPRAIASYRPKSVIRNEGLRDSPRKFMSSHTSLSCQSCTCGSQLQLNNLDESSDSPSGSKELRKEKTNKIDSFSKTNVDTIGQKDDNLRGPIPDEDRGKSEKVRAERTNVMPSETCDSTDLEKIKGQILNTNH